jgi:hypothetical protein
MKPIKTLVPLKEKETTNKQQKMTTKKLTSQKRYPIWTYSTFQVYQSQLCIMRGLGK